MSRFGDVMKGGWHPKGKDGGKESWRGDFKGINQVAGWMGKGKQPGSGDAGGSEHMSRPLATLKDPSSFGPPPKNVNYHGGAALPNEITPHRGGLGAPLTQTEITSARAVNSPEPEEQEEETKPPGPPLPYRADRTGLKTDHLPPPPVHRDMHSPAQEAGQTARASPNAKPGLPPRLPARQNSSNAPISAPNPQPPTYEAAIQSPQPASTLINRNTTNRLEKAGVSVPSLGIGATNPWKTETSHNQTASPPPPAASQSQMSELQARFARMASSSRSSTPPPQAQTPPVPQSSSPVTSAPPSQGTTLAEKQSAFQTAQRLHQEPSTVTLADAQSAAKTANNFRERHQEQISAGATKANAWNKKFNVTGRLNNFLEKQVSDEHVPQHAAPAQASPELSASIARKPPPPPPPKKPAGMHAPPPVPLGTRPSFG